MSIIIFGDIFSFPDGQAATNRIYTYAKGFIEKGIKVHVIVFSNEYNEVHTGIADGIHYYYPFRQKQRSNSFLLRRWQTIQKYFRTWHLVKRIHQQDKVIAINSWTNLLRTVFVAWLLCKRCGAKLITECSEHPLRFHQQGFYKKQSGKFKFFMESWLADGILCISRYLMDFHLRHQVPAKKLLLVPSTVDASRFLNLFEKPVAGKYIGYFGSLTFKRDNVDLLIRAFAKFNATDKGVQLILGGYCIPEMKKNITELVHELKIQDKVQVLDFLTREEILKYITNADILVMTRSRDLESDASYPSKLTEFLSTGRPVITVDVGEVSDFLKDGENAFLIQPAQVDELTEKMHFIFKNYDLALQVAQRGKALTSTVFSYTYQAQRILDFIHILNKK